MSFVVRLLLKLYRLLISPIFSTAFGVHCRYPESCSRYAERMITEKGLVRAVPLSIRRILSCNPWKEVYGK